MLLKSEIDSGVVGRSTYCTDHYHVDDENSHRNDDFEENKANDFHSGKCSSSCCNLRKGNDGCSNEGKK